LVGRRAARFGNHGRKRGSLLPRDWPEIELGWNTFRAYWGQGIATEAATAVVRYVFDVRRERRVTALIDPPNTASIRVATHLGMSFESDADFFGKVVRRYVLPAGDAAVGSVPSSPLR
ncbi:MAG: GNAT family N-acetyltransferase, partial [Polyangiaceae bacterium]